MKIGTLAILLVEDHFDTASMLRLLLSRDGYTVTVVGSCADALIRARHHQFDLLICDLGLPDGDGCALLKSLRLLYPIRAMAMTGFAHDSDRARATAAGFDFFIAKPCDFSKVQNLLATLAAEKVDADGPFSLTASQSH